MKIFPAIDIKDKKCVRLVRGDFDNKTEYEISPVEQAGKYLSLIHISEPTRRRGISYAVFCLKKKKL